MSRYRCVDDQKAAGFPVTTACQAAGVSTSGYYDWVQREAAGPTVREIAEAEVVELMREVIPEGAKVVFLGDGEFDGTALQATLHEAGWSYACRTAMSTVAGLLGGVFGR